ncbi:two-partner secretion domain-containing protein [Methylovulum miyakonense]|uniref:two-partner secretion domain-containing protein n=1 Tax=Methylovulum miyakonense TaxID=645578 RepID=UPI000361D289|nr:filamentous hemagglutinin N-terminal domain-containing protein [Methylovulum miyakonense]
MVIIQHIRELFPRHKLVLALSAGLGISPITTLASPTGAIVVSGSAQIGQTGAVTDINQHTDKAEIDWQGFSISGGETVNFHQPGSSSITLNRVLGNERSVIDGALNANGQIFLINSSGVLFTKGSSVNAAGLVASTLVIRSTDFKAGRYIFQDTGGSGSVINMGTLSATDGGYVALIGEAALNQGVIIASRGTVALGAGEKITLNFNGDSLLNVSLDQGALNALVENRKAIYADGGKVLLTARAADELLASQVNNSGLVEAHTLGDLKGEIVVHAYGGSAHIDGTLDASAPEDGDGGFIETSGDQVKVADSARITTQAAAGRIGHWLIDPDGFTIAAAGGDMTGQAVSNALSSNNLTLTSTQGSGNSGDLNVNDLVNWSSNTILGLIATRSVNINAPITGANGGLALSAGADVNFNAPSSANVASLTATAGGDINFNAPHTWTAPGAWRFAGNNINVNDAVSWADGRVTFNAAKLINLNAVMTVSNHAELVATYNTAKDTSKDANGVPTPTYGAPLGGFNPLFDDTKQEFVGRLDFVNNQAESPLTINGNRYTLITSIGGSGAHDLSVIDANTAPEFGSIGYYALAADLTAPSTAFAKWPIHWLGGYDSNAGWITAGLEGLGHAIRNLTINDQSGANYGTALIGEVFQGSFVSNLNLVNINVTGSFSYVGTLVGRNHGFVGNSYARGTVSASAITDNFGSLHALVDVGGFIGYSDGTIYRSGADVAVTTKDVLTVGGFVGLNYSSGNLTDESGNPFPFGVILDSYARGALNLTFTNYNATVDPSSDIGFGGFVGTNYSLISGSSSSGSVTVVAQTPEGYPIALGNIGGFAGVNTSGFFNANAVISNSTSSSSVTGTVIGGPDQGGFGLIGGFVGKNYAAQINNSSAFGRVNADNAYDVGGFAGNNTNGVLTGNTFNSATTGQNFGIGDIGNLTPSNEGTANTTDQNPSPNQGRQPSSQAQNASDARTQAQALNNQATAQRIDAAAQEQAAAQAAAQAAQQEAEQAATQAAQQADAARTASQLGSTRTAEVQRYAGPDALANANISSAATPPAPIDNNIVQIEPASYSAHVRSIEVDGVTYDLDEEDEKEDKSK